MEFYYKNFLVVLTVFIFSVPAFRTEPLNRELSGNERSVRWISRGDVRVSRLQPGSFGGHTLYTARIPYLDGVIPGYVGPDATEIIFGYDGKMLHADSNFELLEYPKGTLGWEEVMDGSRPPPNPFEGGTQPRTLEPLCVCRAWINQHTRCLGKFARSEKFCRVPYDGTEKLYDHFDILVWNEGDLGIQQLACRTSPESSAGVIVLSVIVVLLLVTVAGILYYFKI